MYRTTVRHDSVALAGRRTGEEDDARGAALLDGAVDVRAHHVVRHDGLENEGVGRTRAGGRWLRRRRERRGGEAGRSNIFVPGSWMAVGECAIEPCARALTPILVSAAPPLAVRVVPYTSARERESFGQRLSVNRGYHMPSARTLVRGISEAPHRSCRSQPSRGRPPCPSCLPQQPRVTQATHLIWYIPGKDALRNSAGAVVTLAARAPVAHSTCAARRRRRRAAAATTRRQPNTQRSLVGVAAAARA